MSEPLSSSLHQADPTQMSRLDFPVGSVLATTGKRVHEVFDDTNDGTGKIKDNEIFIDPDGVGSWVEINPQDGDMNIFMSLFFRGILPTAEELRVGQKGGAKEQNKYYSLAFDPEKIQRPFTDVECFAGCHILEAFGDMDHYYIGETGERWNVAKKGAKHYFFDFHLSKTRLKKFPPKEIRYGGYEFMRREVREAFYRMIGELKARYEGESGKMHFFAIVKKAGIPPRKVGALWAKFMIQIEKLGMLDEKNLEGWVRANEKFMVD